MQQVVLHQYLPKNHWLALRKPTGFKTSRNCYRKNSLVWMIVILENYRTKSSMSDEYKQNFKALFNEKCMHNYKTRVSFTIISPLNTLDC